MERTGTLEPQDKIRTKEVGTKKIKTRKQHGATVNKRKRFANKYAKLL